MGGRGGSSVLGAGGSSGLDVTKECKLLPAWNWRHTGAYAHEYVCGRV